MIDALWNHTVSNCFIECNEYVLHIVCFVLKRNTDIYECLSSPCQNGGSCYDQVNGYFCTCQQGYNGDECETG